MARFSGSVVANIAVYFVVITAYQKLIRPILLSVWTTGGLVRDVVGFLTWGMLVLFAGLFVLRKLRSW